MLASVSSSLFVCLFFPPQYFSCSFICIMPFSPWLPLCVCIYELGIYSMSLSLVRLALFSRCLVWLSDAVVIIIWTRSSRNVPCVGFVNPLIVVESWFVLDCLWVGLTFKLTDFEYQPPMQCPICCTGLDLTKQNYLQRIMVSVRLPLDLSLIKLIGLCSDVVWSFPPSILVLEHLGRDFHAGQYQMRPVTGPGLPGRSYKAIQDLWLPLISLGICRRIQATYRGHHPPVKSLGKFSVRGKAPWNSTPSAGYLLGSVLKEPLVYMSCMRQVLNHQTHQVDTNSKLASVMGLRPLSKNHR